MFFVIGYAVYGVAQEKPQINYENNQIQLTAIGATQQIFKSDAVAFGNRQYVWQNVPKELDGFFFTQTRGGETAFISVTAKEDTCIYVAAAVMLDDENENSEWTVLASNLFQFTDVAKTSMYLFRRNLKKGEKIDIPQTCWTGTILFYGDEPVNWPRPVLSSKLIRMKYNNPGLIDFLAVGLWSWPIPMDADGDGDFDLIISCEDTPYNGVYFFENASNDPNCKFPIFKAAKRLSEGQINVQLSYIDGVSHVLTPSREYPDFANTGLQKPVELGLKQNPHKNNVRGNMWKYVDFNGDGKLDIVVGSDDWTDYGWDNAWNEKGEWTNGPLRGFLYLLQNEGTTEAPKYAEPKPIYDVNGTLIETYGWPSPSFADFDNDGDLDLFCGEFRDRFTYYENIGSATEPVYTPGCPVPDITGGRAHIDLEMATPIVFDWNRDGKFDFLCGDEDGRIAYFENTGKFSESTLGDKMLKTPVFAEPVYFEQEADYMKAGSLCSPFVVDWDGDGVQDVICGNAAGYILFFKNLSPPGEEFPKWARPVKLTVDLSTAPDGVKVRGFHGLDGRETEGKPETEKIFRIMAGPNGSIQGPCEEKWGYITQSVADWNNDGLPDILVNSIWGEVIVLENIGTRTEPKLAAPQVIEVEWNGQNPELAWGWVKPIGKQLLTQWRTTPVAYDWNGDGLCDLLMLDQEGYFSFFERFKKEDGSLALKHPARIFVDKNGNPLRLTAGKSGGSGRRKIAVGDFDGDGNVDLMLNSFNTNFFRQIDAKDGKFFFEDLGSVAIKRLQGHSSHPTFCDFNADGVPDLLIGAEDGHFYYLHNPGQEAR